MLEKNKIYTAEIEEYGCNGEGIARICGMPCFIEGAIKGEQAEILIVKVLKNYAYGKLLKVLKPSPYRTEVGCPAFKRCGGCQLLHIEWS